MKKESMENEKRSRFVKKDRWQNRNAKNAGFFKPSRFKVSFKNKTLLIENLINYVQFVGKDLLYGEYVRITYVKSAVSILGQK